MQHVALLRAEPRAPAKPATSRRGGLSREASPPADARRTIVLSNLGELPCGSDDIVQYTVHDPIGSYRSATRTPRTLAAGGRGGVRTPPPESHRFEVPVARGVLGTVAATRQPTESATPCRLPEFEWESDLHFFEEESVLVLPLIERNAAAAAGDDAAAAAAEGDAAAAAAAAAEGEHAADSEQACRGLLGVLAFIGPAGRALHPDERQALISIGEMVAAALPVLGASPEAEADMEAPRLNPNPNPDPNPNPNPSPNRNPSRSRSPNPDPNSNTRLGRRP